MENKFSKIFVIVLTLSLPLSLVGCTDYWWTRGQPPSVETLLQRSNNRLDESLAQNSSNRSDIADLTKQIRQAFLDSKQSLEKEQAKEQKVAALFKAHASMMQLEGHLSIGSRAAYGELSGELRGFINTLNSEQEVSASSFGLYAARTFFFLADELKMPAPSFS